MDLRPRGAGGARRGRLLQGGADVRRTVQPRYEGRGEQAFERVTDLGKQILPRVEHRGSGGRPREAGEDGVGGEAPYGRGPEGREDGGVGAVGLHAPVPRQQPGAQLLRGRRQLLEAGEQGEQRLGRCQVGVPVDVGHRLRGPVRGAAEQLADAVGAVRRRELHAERGGDAARVRHDGEALDGLGGGRRPALPGVLRLPRGHGTQPVGAVAQRHGTRDAVQQAAFGVGGVDDVDRLGPAVEGAVDVGDGAGAQQGGEGGEPEVAADAGRVAQGEGLGAAVGVGVGVGVSIGVVGAGVGPGAEVAVRAHDHRAAGGLQDLHLDVVAAGHGDGLRVARDGLPDPARAERLDGAVRAAAQPLDVQVLVVGHRVGDGPGGGAGVPEVGEAGHTGDGEAQDVVVRAGQADLLVDARVLDEAVRVARDDRRAAGGAVARHHPAVAAGDAGAVGGEEGERLVSEGAGHALAPQLGGEAGEQDVRGDPDRQRHPRLPGEGARPVRAKRSSRAAPSARPSLTPSTYARTQAAVAGSSASMAS